MVEELLARLAQRGITLLADEQAYVHVDAEGEEYPEPLVSILMKNGKVGVEMHVPPSVLEDGCALDAFVDIAEEALESLRGTNG